MHSTLPCPLVVVFRGPPNEHLIGPCMTLFPTPPCLMHRTNSSRRITDLGHLSHTVRMSLPQTMHLYGLPKIYSAVQLHFHWGSKGQAGGSEHKMDSQAFLGEVGRPAGWGCLGRCSPAALFLTFAMSDPPLHFYKIIATGGPRLVC